MNKRLIHFAGILPVMLAFIACSASDTPSTDVIAADDTARGCPIGFTVDEAPSSRTAVGTVTGPQLRADGFGVFACYSGEHPYASTTVTSNLMWNQKVEYTASAWSYTPLKFWPNGHVASEVDEYVSFFAYVPFSEADGSDNASSCIIEFSNPYESGDPWLVYRLGGNADSWQSRQVDLLYAFVPDQKKPADSSSRVSFSFRHALATAGDEVSVACDASLQEKLKALAASAGATVTLTLDRLTLDYSLTQKGRLVLNNASEPNWQPVESEDPLVHRLVTMEPDRVMATATSDACSVTGFSRSDIGVFYIPMNPAGLKQQVEVTADYSLSTGFSGSASATIDLSVLGMDSRQQSFTLTLSDEVQIQP